MEKTRRAISLAAFALILITLILVVGTGLFLNTRFDNGNTTETTNDSVGIPCCETTTAFQTTTNMSTYSVPNSSLSPSLVSFNFTAGGFNLTLSAGPAISLAVSQCSYHLSSGANSYAYFENSTLKMTVSLFPSKSNQSGSDYVVILSSQEGQLLSSQEEFVSVPFAGNPGTFALYVNSIKSSFLNYTFEGDEGVNSMTFVLPLTDSVASYSILINSTFGWVP
jgi:hypothetical protein